MRCCCLSLSIFPCLFHILYFTRRCFFWVRATFCPHNFYYILAHDLFNVASSIGFGCSSSYTSPDFVYRTFDVNNAMDGVWAQGDTRQCIYNALYAFDSNHFLVFTHSRSLSRFYNSMAHSCTQCTICCVVPKVFLINKSRSLNTIKCHKRECRLESPNIVAMCAWEWSRWPSVFTNTFHIFMSKYR